MVQRSNPPPPWSWVSHSTVPLPPVVWWGCGTAFIIYIYMYMCIRFA